jgi:hypothetical protein
MYEFIFNDRYDKSLIRILDIIWKDLDVEAAQMPSRTKQEIFNKICSDLKAKTTFAIHKSDVVFLVIPDSPWVARLHIFTVDEGVNMRERMKAGKELTAFIFRNTKIEKVYGVTANKKFITMGKYAGWKPGQEGVLSKSYHTNDGKLIDQFIVSVNKSEFMK